MSVMDFNGADFEKEHLIEQRKAKNAGACSCYQLNSLWRHFVRFGCPN